MPRVCMTAAFSSVVAWSLLVACDPGSPTASTSEQVTSAVLSFFPRGGRLSLQVGARERKVYLAEKRSELVALLLRLDEHGVTSWEPLRPRPALRQHNKARRVPGLARGSPLRRAGRSRVQPARTFFRSGACAAGASARPCLAT